MGLAEGLRLRKRKRKPEAMSENPLVSFVVPCHNYGRFLPECLRAIQNQDFDAPLEIVAVNDGSTDDTAEVLRAAAAQDHRVRVLDHPQNMGHVATLNDGLKAARGRYVARVDPDDRHHPHFLRTLIPALESEARVGLAYGNFNLINTSGEVTEASAGVRHRGPPCVGNEFVELLGGNPICSPTVIARREAWMMTWPVPAELVCDDWYCNLQMASCWDFHRSPVVVADYRVHENNHHTRVSRDGSEERSVLRLLDWVYSRVEQRAELQTAKQLAKASIYARQYLDFGRKYFGHAMHADARRCFWLAWRSSPRLVMSPAVLRWWAASFLSPRLWRSLKRVVPGRRVEGRS